MYLMYNLRERGGDPPDKYLKSAELIARVSGYALLHRLSMNVRRSDAAYIYNSSLQHMHMEEYHIDQKLV
jgi:hypothetical protein